MIPDAGVLGLFFDLLDQFALVVPAGRAHTVRKMRLAAVLARNRLGRRDGVVGAALVAP